LARFVYREARLIDEKRLDEWYELFSEDALYWMPLVRGQTDPHSHTSLFCEDKFLLKVRIERLKNPLSHSQQQPKSSAGWRTASVACRAHFGSRPAPGIACH